MTDEKKMAADADDPGSVEERGPASESGKPAQDTIVLEGQVANLTDRLLRAHAEMDNLRKRNERDKSDIAKFAISKFSGEILAVGDNLQRAIAAVPPGAAEALCVAAIAWEIHDRTIRPTSICGVIGSSGR